MDKIQKAFEAYRDKYKTDSFGRERPLIPWHVWQAAINWFKLDNARTSKQNALYWRRLEEIAQQATDEDGRKYNAWCWHIYCKMEIMPMEFENKHGKIVTKFVELPNNKFVLRSTKEMCKKDFGEYVTAVEANFAGRGVRFSANGY